MNAHRLAVRGTALFALGLRCVVFAAFACAASASDVEAHPTYAIFQQSWLVRFDGDQPVHNPPVTYFGVSGLDFADMLIDLDVRPATGELYGLALSGAGYARLYRIAVDESGTVTPTATRVSERFPCAAPGGGMDFDPVNDRVRVVGASRESYSIDTDTGAVTTLPSLSSGSLGGIAFTHSVAGATTSTLYGIDAATNSLVRIGDVDATDGGANGVVTVLGSVSPGQVSIQGGLEIEYDSDTTARAVLRMAGNTNAMVWLDLSTGATVMWTPLEDLGYEAAGLTIYRRVPTIHGVNTNNQLVTFRANAPDVPIDGTPRALTGLQAGEIVEALDARPSNGALYALTNQARLYTLEPATGAMSLVTGLAGTLSGTHFGMDVDPVADRIVISSDASQLISVNPQTGAVITLPTPSVPLTGLAFSSNRVGATTTTLYGLASSGFDRLYTIDPATSVATQMNSFIFLPDVTDLAAVDVSPGDDDQIYAALNRVSAPGVSNLYVLDWFTGGAYQVGTQPIAGGAPLRAMAVASRGYLRLQTPETHVTEGPAAPPGRPASIVVERVAGSDGPISGILLFNESESSPRLLTDYTPGQGQFTFRSGESGPMPVAAINVLDDLFQERSEALGVTLQSASPGSVTFGRTQAELVIDDDDYVPPTIEIRLPATSETYAASSSTISLAGRAHASLGAVQSITWVSDRGFSGSAFFEAGLASPDWVAFGVPLVAGVNVITVTAKDSSFLAGERSDTITITLAGRSYYLAEGATGHFFQYDLLFANPNQTTIEASVQFLNEQGPVLTWPLLLSGMSRSSLRVNTIPGLEQQGGLSAIVTALGELPIVVERTMTWDERGYGSATDHASEGLFTTWYFAEGAQGFYKTYLLLANPQAAPNVAHVRYFREDEPVVVRDYPLAPFARFTLDAGTDPELRFRAFGIEVTFDQPGMAERAMYFGGPPQFLGGHESAGVNALSRTWFLAEGATGDYFKTYVLMANPSDTEATVQIDFLLSTGDVVHKTRTVGPGARASIDIAAQDPKLMNVAVATRVTSDVPIVVERAQYWPGGPATWQEAHNSFGVMAPAYKWGLAEGRVGMGSHYQTYILVANPGDTPAQVTAVFMRPAGAGPRVEKTFTVGPNSRFTLFGDLAVPELKNEVFSTILQSDQPIVVERAMYSDALGIHWKAGTNATAVRLP